MEPEWNDLYVRTDLSDNGPGQRGGGFSSPDIIPAGIWPIDPTVYTSPESYKTYPANEPFQQDRPNYIYVRAKNSATGSNAKGEAFLVLTDPAVVLWPGGDKWVRIKTQSQTYGSELKPNPTSPGAIAVTKDPFVYIPSDTGHRCLVTWLSTQSHPQPDPPPEIHDANKLVEFLKAHPNYAHHNIDIVADNNRVVTQQKAFSSGTTETTWRFGVEVTGGNGFTVSCSSGKQLPSGEYITLAPFTITQNTTVAALTGRFTVPAGWDTFFNYSYDQNLMHPTDFAVNFVAYATYLPGHPLYADGRPFHELGVPRHLAPADERAYVLGSIGVMKGVI